MNVNGHGTKRRDLGVEGVERGIVLLLVGSIRRSGHLSAARKADNERVRGEREKSGGEMDSENVRRRREWRAVEVSELEPKVVLRWRLITFDNRRRKEIETPIFPI